MDGRWHIQNSSKLVYQLYVIHALKGGPLPLEDGHLLPCLFILLTHKSAEIYDIMWSEVKKLCPDSTPSHLIVDFERAAIIPFSVQYPDTQIKGCFFHLTQNFWRKIQELSTRALATRYQQEPSFALQLRMILALSFARPDDVPEISNQLLTVLPVESSELTMYLKTHTSGDIQGIFLLYFLHYFQSICGVTILWFTKGCLEQQTP